MRYQEFLFTQLFMNFIENNDTEYIEFEYDLIYPEVMKHLSLYINSSYNIDTKSEYECMNDYLINTLK